MRVPKDYSLSSSLSFLPSSLSLSPPPFSPFPYLYLSIFPSPFSLVT